MSQDGYNFTTSQPRFYFIILGLCEPLGSLGEALGSLGEPLGSLDEPLGEHHDSLGEPLANLKKLLN